MILYLSACATKSACKKLSFPLYTIIILLYIDTGSNEEKSSKVELNTYSSTKQITGCNRAYHYEEVNTNSHLSRPHASINQASYEGIEMTTNIVYALTKKIETKTNVAYATTGGLHQTRQ